MSPASRDAIRRLGSTVIVVVLLLGDLLRLGLGDPPAPRSAHAQPREEMPVPANPCAPQIQQEKKKKDPPVPPSVGRDKADQILKERRQQQQDLLIEQDRRLHGQPPPTGDDAIKSLGDRLRRQQIPGGAVASTAGTPDPG
jgi:hypothetical protein